MPNNSFIRDLEENQRRAEEEQELIRKAWEHRDALIHRTFVQTESGRELLELWKQTLVDKEVVRHGESHDPYDIGIEAGLQKFIRNIIKTCKKVEKQL